MAGNNTGVQRPVLGSVVVHPPCIREVPGSNPIRRLIYLDRVIPEDFKKLIVTASLLNAQHQGIESWKGGAYLLDKTRLAMPIVLAEITPRCNLEQVASDLACPLL